MRERDAPPWWLPHAATAAVLALVCLRVAPHLRDDAWDYDEGPNLQTAWSWREGASLYREIPLNKPPLLVSVVRAAFALGGVGLTPARVAMLALSLLGAWSLGRVAARAGGPWAAPLTAALLATQSTWVARTPTVMADLPALSCVALAAYLGAGDAAPWRRVAGGVALGLAGLFHPLSLTMAVPWALREAARRRARALAPLCAAAAVTAWPWCVFDRASYARWLIDYNRAPTAQGLSLTAPNGVILRDAIIADAPWVFATVCAAAWCWRRGLRGAVFAAWGAWLATLATLSLWRPLWDNYLLWPRLPLLALVAAALGDAIAARWRLALAGLAVSAAVASLEVVPWCRWEAPRTTLREALEGARGAVVTDDPFVAFAAGRRVPAGLADTSFKRIATGFLTAAELERAVRDQAVTTVLSASGRFARMPGFEAYAARAMTVTWREGDATLYRVTDAGSGTPSRGR